MRPQDLHTHSLFDDGKASLEQMVLSAMDKGFAAIGLSGHSPIPEANDWTIPAEKLSAYVAEARRLQEEYRGRIPVYVGLEYDLRSDLDLSGFDYVIGSVHALAGKDVDNTAQIAMDSIRDAFGGDPDAAAETYFAQYAAIAENPNIDIVGHFDLLTKFDEKQGIYNANSPRYLHAAKAAMELLVRAGKIFEINSGAISRGYRTLPYPSKELLCTLRELGGKICLNSDAHSPEGIGCAFGQSLQIAKACGFTELWYLTAEGFQTVPISEIVL